MGSPGFPALPSTNNPSLGAAAQASSSAASIYNGLMSALNQAGDLKQRQKAQKAAQGQQAIKDLMEAYNQGAVDVPLSQQAPRDIQPGRPTLQLPYPTDTPVEPGGTTSTNAAPSATPSSYSMDPKRIMNVGGKPMYFPTAAEKQTEKQQNELDDSNSFIPQGQLADMLQSAGVKKGARIKASDSHSLLQAINEAQPKDEPYDIDTSGKFLGPDGKPVPVLVGKKTGTVRMLDLSGGKQPQTPGASAGGPFSLPDGWTGAAGAQPSQNSPTQAGNGVTFAPPEKAAKAPKNLHFEPSTNDRGDVTMRGFDPETGELKSTNVAPGIGPKRKDPDATAASDAKAKAREDRQQTERDRAQTLINTLQTKEQEQHQARSAYGAILAQPDSESKEANGQKVLVIDPDSRREEYLTPARRAYYQAQYDAATGLRDTYHQQSTKLIKRYGGDPGVETYSPDKPAETAQPQQQARPAAGTAPTATAPAKQPAAPLSAAKQPTAQVATARQPAAQAAPKTASLANIRAYAKKNGMAEADAIRKAKAEGYQIGQ